MKQRISIKDLAIQYSKQGKKNGYSYLCHFIAFHLGLGKTADIGDSLRIQWCARFNIDSERAGASGTILEIWNTECEEFDDVSTLMSARDYRVACLRRAAHLHPDWVLEF